MVISNTNSSSYFSMKNGSLCFLFVLIILFSQCQSQENPTPDNIGGAYFPLELGSFVEYQVREEKYTVTNPVVILQYQVREVVADTFNDINKQKSFRIERYKRNTNTQNWTLDSVWVAKKTGSQAIRVESNLSFIKLAFPLNENTTWNGNALNALGNDDYIAKEVGWEKKVNNITYPNTATVIQADDSSLVSVDRRREIYAENIGLIFKEQRKINYCDEASCIGNNTIIFGFIYTQTLIKYGKQ